MKGRKTKIIVMCCLIGVLLGAFTFSSLLIWLYAKHSNEVASINVNASEGTSISIQSTVNENSICRELVEDIATDNTETESSRDSTNSDAIKSDEEQESREDNKFTPIPKNENNYSIQAATNNTSEDTTKTDLRSDLAISSTTTKPDMGKKNTANNITTPIPDKDNHSSQPVTSESKKEESVMTDIEFQQVKDTVNDYAETATKAASVNINSLVLSLSGLGPTLDSAKQKEAELEKQIVEFNRISNGIKASEIKDESKEKIIYISSEISLLSTNLHENLSDLKVSMNEKNIDAVGLLLEDISRNFIDTSGMLVKLNAVLDEI